MTATPAPAWRKPNSPREAALCLALLPGVRLGTLWRRFQGGETLEDLWAAALTGGADILTSAGLARVAGGAQAGAHGRAVEDALRDHAFAVWGEPGYPVGLARLDDPPPALFVRGKLPDPGTPAVAIVGTRDPSPYAADATRALARELAAQGVTIISGGAQGIDAAAHEGALEAGTTVCVFATGIAGCSPAAHAGLFARIAATGGIASEFAGELAASRYAFPRRNRLIAGLAQGVVVMAGGASSGALITAQAAASLGLPVMAWPGPVGDPRSEGPHSLIRNGALLVDSAQAVLEGLGHPRAVRVERKQAAKRGPVPEPVSGAKAAPPPRAPHTAPRAALEPRLQMVLDAIGSEILTLDDLAARLGGSIHGLHPSILELELLGAVRQLPGNRVEAI